VAALFKENDTSGVKSDAEGLVVVIVALVIDGN